MGQNGSSGTDHGAAAPLFLFGDGIAGGIYGNAPDLNNLENGNLKHDIDFRSVYATILKDWFGLDAANVELALLGYQSPSLNFIKEPTGVGRENEERPVSFDLHQNYPNPFNPTTTITYTTSQSGPVKVEVFDVQGRQVQLLENGVVTAGRHSLTFDAQNLPSGTYIYRLITPQGVQSKKMVLLR